MSDLLNQYRLVRAASESICRNLSAEDYVVQPVVDVSPPKWHLAHTTWFFETFILSAHSSGYQVFHPAWGYLFNSYYETVGERVPRADRGNLSRPTVDEVYAYRSFVDDAMAQFLERNDLSPELEALVVLGLNHEKQHQELLITDIKYILGHNPLYPPLEVPELRSVQAVASELTEQWAAVGGGVYSVGVPASHKGFSFDNEHGAHKQYIEDFEIRRSLVTNREYLAFIEDGGYQRFDLWHSDGWSWVQETNAEAPLYWQKPEQEWMVYDFNGLRPVEPDLPVAHVNFYEASAFAAWKGCRLPTESEWEVASHKIQWGERWEWTNSAYLPYPGFSTASGAVGEYNGKFMVNQMVLRGGSVATPEGHSRKTYRNFFQPWLQWQYMGIRLVR